MYLCRWKNIKTEYHWLSSRRFKVTKRHHVIHWKVNEGKMGRQEDGGTYLIHTAYNIYSYLLPPLNPILPILHYLDSVSPALWFLDSQFFSWNICFLCISTMLNLDGLCQPSDNIRTTIEDALTSFNSACSKTSRRVHPLRVIVLFINIGLPRSTLNALIFQWPFKAHTFIISTFTHKGMNPGRS